MSETGSGSAKTLVTIGMGSWKALAEKTERDLARACHLNHNESDDHDCADEIVARRERLEQALRALITAEDRFVNESGMKLDDAVSDAAKRGRAVLEAAKPKVGE